ncbi:MAG: hypothetical protein JXB45_08030 [Candidatus Krumholzibacteriota bacterium]|nr:hypothetical protein [Candidatus Krumholzibacteriota bacterium]
MKGSKIVFSIAMLALILAATNLSAQIPNGIPLDKQLSPGYSIVKFDGIIYRIYTEGSVRITFRKIDNQHHSVKLIPIGDNVFPFCDVVVQWGCFFPVCLGIDSASGETYILGTETGYAEK